MSWEGIESFDLNGNGLEGWLPMHYAAWTGSPQLYVDVSRNFLQGKAKVLKCWRKKVRPALTAILHDNNLWTSKEVKEACEDGSGEFTCIIEPQRKGGEPVACFSGSSLVHTMAGPRPIGELGSSDLLETSADFHGLEQDRWLW